jgi:YVTN family beta-propeller protein
VRNRTRWCLVALSSLVAATAAAAEPAGVRTVAIVAGQTAPVMMDYLAYDRSTDRVWVPAGNTASVLVLEASSERLERVPGFATAEVERDGHKRLIGPSSATVGDGVVYVGNRGDSSICAFDAKTLAKRQCGKVRGMPDGIAFVASTHEVWVTTPRDRSLVVLDAATLAEKAKVTVEGEPEGYAVDDAHGRFYTNLEDGNRTLAIDLRSRKVVATWSPGCGEAGPRGMALDGRRGFLVVACTDHLAVLDLGHDGKLVGRLDTGAGVDNIDYLESRQEIFAGAGGAGQLVVGKLSDAGALAPVSTVKTHAGTRNVVASASGAAFLIDPQEGAVMVVPVGAR